MHQRVPGLMPWRRITFPHARTPRAWGASVRGEAKAPTARKFLKVIAGQKVSSTWRRPRNGEPGSFGRNERQSEGFPLGAVLEWHRELGPLAALA